MVQQYKMYVNGAWTDAVSRKTFNVVNPATESAIARVPLGGKGDVDKAVAAARRAFDSGVWSEKTPGERAAVLWKLADLTEQNLHELARLETIQVGKTIKYSTDSDLPFIIDNLRFFAGASRILEGTAAAEYTGMGTSIIRREPVGVVGAIVPWNYPLFIAVWKLAPALAAGNTLVIKPASATPLTLLAFTKLVEKAGIPKGVFNVVTGPGNDVGTALAEHPRVDMISLTGDTSTGKEIMRQASATLKRLHLELGGKAPLIVLDDANLEMAAEGAVIGAFWNGGQDCTAVTRIYVPEKMHDAFVKKLVEKTKKFRIGDPMSKTTDLGPLISAKQRERVEAYVRTGVKEGGRVVCGGKRPVNLKKGFYFEPTILTHVKHHHRLCQEEVFGPVACVFPYKKLDDAIMKANDVQYGLAASVYGSNIHACMRVAKQLHFGTVWINEHGVLASEMPHGGVKQSGFGKDLGLYAFNEYTTVKHVYVDATNEVRRSWHYTVYGQK